MKMKSVIAGRIHRAAGAGAHDQRDLRDHAASHHVALEHVGIAAERSDAFLDARAARVVEADHRRADLHRLVHDLADLLGMRLGQRAAEHREVLREDEHHAAVDGAVAGHHAVAGDLAVGHAEIDAAVLLEHVPFFEGAVVEQQFDALARRQLALGVLGVDALLAAAEAGLLALFVQLLDDFVHVIALLVVTCLEIPVHADPSRRCAAAAGVMRAGLDGRVISSGSVACTAGMLAEALAQAGIDQLPHPGQRLVAAARREFAAGRQRAAR